MTQRDQEHRTTVVTEVASNGPLDLRLTLEPLRLGSWDPTIRFVDGAVEWAFHTPEGPAAMRAWVVGELVRSEAWGTGAEWAARRVGDLVGATDPAELFAPEHPAARELVRRRPGLRLARTHRVVDVLVPSILQQLVTWEDAAHAYARLVRAHGSPAPGPLGLMLPPRAEDLAAVSRSHLMAAGALGKQADTIRRVLSVRRRMEECTTMSADDAARRLQAVPGVGAWTANIVMLRGLGFPDAVPTGDVHIPHNVAWLLAGEPRADDARMLELLEPFRGHRGRLIRLMQAAGVTAPRRGPRSPLRRWPR